MRETVSEIATHSAAPAQTVRAPRGTALSCKGWQQEAAFFLQRLAAGSGLAHAHE